MIIFENPGLLDLRLVTTFGANVKNSESAIGYFGTGMKYALAVLARLGANVEIQIGHDTHEISVSFESLRGKQFGIVCLDGKPLAFTTELGKNWEPWMAFRELYCNALDEGGSTYASTSPEPEADKTRFIVQSPEIDTVFQKKDTWFLSDTPDTSVSGVDIFFRPSPLIFYRGIAVHKLRQSSRFTYNLTEKQTLTEDRTLANNYSIMSTLSRLVQSNHPRIIKMLTTLDGNEMESECWFNHQRPSPELIEAVLAKFKAGATINGQLLEACKKYAPEMFTKESVEPTEREKAIIQASLDFLRKAGYEVTEPIKLFETLGTNVLGQGPGSEIYLSRLCLSKGTKIVAGTIFEEHLHNRHDLVDETRRFQDYLLDLCITLMEEKYKVYL